MSKKMGDLKKAADDGLDKFFSDLPSGEELFEPEVKKPVKTEPEKKPVKKVFSFRTLAEDADDWRIWADAKGMKVDDLGTLALKEYIKRHKLTEDQQQIYELKKAQKKS